MPITREDYVESNRKVQLYGNLAAMLVFYGVLIAVFVLSKPLVVGFGELLRSYFKNDGVVGLLGGLAIGLSLVPFLLLPVFALLWIDRLAGVRCPSCNRSVSLRCSKARVLRTGQCCNCGKPLFSEDE